MSCSYNIMCLFVVMATMTLCSTRLCCTGSSLWKDGNQSNENRRNSSIEDMSSWPPARQPLPAEDDENDMTSSSSLFRGIERRRPKNFRGDLGKRGGNAIAPSTLGSAGVVGSRRGSRVPNRKLRPDLGKRVYSTNDDNIGKDLYSSWPPNSRYDDDVDESTADEDGNNAMTLFGSYNQQALGDTTQYETRDEPHVDQSSTMLAMERSSRGRSSSFRGDLGKRRAKSSFRGDLGKRSVRRRRSVNVLQTDWLQAAADRRSTDIEDNTQEMTDNVDLSPSFTEELDKRGRGKSSFRGDLGKRWNQFPGDDLGGNIESKSVISGSLCPQCYDDLTSTKIDKRPRSSSFRGDLGKRQSSDLLVDLKNDGVGFEALPSRWSLDKRPRSHYFRGDLGKRN